MRRRSACAAGARARSEPQRHRLYFVTCFTRRTDVDLFLWNNKEVNATQMLPSPLFSSRISSDHRARHVLGCGQAGAERQRSGVVQGEAGVQVVQEVTAEGVQVLPQRRVIEGQDPSRVIQKHADPQRLHRDANVRRPAVVQELVFMPAEEEHVIRFFSLSCKPVQPSELKPIKNSRILKKRPNGISVTLTLLNQSCGWRKACPFSE